MTDTNPECPEPVVLSHGAAHALVDEIDGARGLREMDADSLVHALITALQAHDETGNPTTVTIQIGGE